MSKLSPIQRRIRKKKNISFSRDKMEEILNLTTCQHNALYELNKWYKDDETMICLSGSAGTGKTTLLREFIKKNQLYHQSICVAAPTHQAKEVVSRTTGIREAKSVQELLGLRPDLDLTTFDPSKPTFSPINRAKIVDYDLVIIDEASMVNKELAKHIKQLSHQYNIKILYVGDPFQLAPINEKISTVFTDIRNIELFEIVRQKGDNPISELIALARADVQHGTTTFLDFVKNHKVTEQTDIGYNIVKHNTTFFNDLCSKLKEDEITKFLAYTNDCIDAWNIAARDVLLNKPAEIITNQDTLIGTNNISDGQGDFIVQNSSVYSVVSTAIKYYNRYEKPIKIYETHLKKYYKDSYVNIVHPDSYQTFIDLDYSHRLKALSKGWKDYYNFRNNFCLLKGLIYKDELGQEIKIKRDLAYNFCLTVHKSQGSTFDHVYINLINIMKINRINKLEEREERNRLIYVAISRARKSISILTT